MERLQKVLAQAGVASRRAAEQLILAGRVRVDGRIVRELGTQVDPRTSRVELDGQKIVAEKLVYIVLHKPRGVVCTLSDPEGRPTIQELLKDAGARVVPVGRLDFHTSGALLCTNDGEFAQGLAHPKKGVPKVYVAKVKGAVDDDALERFSQRIEIDGRPTQPAQVRRLRFEGDKTWLEITLREGRNRQVRRLGEATGFPVMRLARISHAGVTSEDLRPGQWRPLSIDELVELKRTYGVPKRVRAPQYLEGEAGKAGWVEQKPGGGRRPAPKHSAAKRREAKARDTREVPEVRGERFSRGEPRVVGRGAKPERSEARGERFSRGEPRAVGRGAKPERTEARGERFSSSEARPSTRGGAAPRGEARGERFSPSASRSSARGGNAQRDEARGERFSPREPRPAAQAKARPGAPGSVRRRGTSR